jgi:hypothetical protein
MIEKIRAAETACSARRGLFAAPVENGNENFCRLKGCGEPRRPKLEGKS